MKRGEIQYPQTTNPVKQEPAIPSQTVSPLPDHEEIIMKESSSISYQPAPKEAQIKDHEDSHVFPSSSPTFDAITNENATTPIHTYITASGSIVPTEGHTPETLSLDWSAVNVITEGDLEEIHHEKIDLPVLQEDFTTYIPVSGAAPLVIPEEEDTNTVGQIPATGITSTHTEKDVPSTSIIPSFPVSTSESSAKEVSREGTSDAQDEETKGSVTPSSTYLVVPTSDSGKLTVVLLST